MAGQTSLVILNADRPRILKAGWFEVSEFERLTGKSFLRGTFEDTLASLSDVRVLAYVFMIQDANNHGEKLTIDKFVLEPGEVSVDDILDAANESIGLDKTMETITAALTKFYDSIGKKEKKKATAEKNSKAADPEQ